MSHFHNKDVSIHGMNVHFLVIEAFKSVNKLHSLVMWNYHNKNIFPHDLEKVYTLQFTPAHSTCHGINSFFFQGSLLWKNFLAKIKVSLSTKKIMKRRKQFFCVQVYFASSFRICAIVQFKFITQLYKLSTVQLQSIAKQLPVRYFVNSLTLSYQEDLLVYLSESKRTLNKVIVNNKVIMKNIKLKSKIDI